MTASTSSALNQASQCPGCGATLEFNPKLGQLSCPYCDRTVQLNSAQISVEEQNLEHWQNGQTQTQLSAQAVEVECRSCHAQINFEPPEVAGDCLFCGTHITAQAHSANPLITSGGILPFGVSQKESRQKLAQWLKTRWFAPSSLKQLAQHESLKGVYLPFWTYDCHTSTRYTGKRGTHYYVTKTRQVKDSDGKFVTETYEECKTQWWSVSGQVSRFFDDLLVPATKTVDECHLKDIGPWSLKLLVAYDSKYLQGFRAQRYQVDVDDGFKEAQALMRSHITSDIKCDIGGDEQRIDSQSTTYRNKTFKHVLLPVWIASYRYKNRSYQVLINGETGKITGERPFSPVKIAGAIAASIVGAVSLFAGSAWLEGDWQDPSESREPSSAVVAPAPSAPASAAAPTPEPQPLVPQSFPEEPSTFDAAMDLAYEAATKTQTAQTEQAWQEVINLWLEAIAKLKEIPPSDPDWQKAQQKVAEYQNNLNYAIDRAIQAR